jgi:hypothetical protein
MVEPRQPSPSHPEESISSNDAQGIGAHVLQALGEIDLGLGGVQGGRPEEWMFLREQLEVGFSLLTVSPCLRVLPCPRENGCLLFLRVSAFSAR